MRSYGYDVNCNRKHTGIRQLVAWACAVTCLAVACPARAREVDQFTDRRFQLQHLADASGVIDAEINAMLSRLVKEFNRRKPASNRDREQLIRDVFQSSRIDYIAQIVTPFESWLRDSAPVDLYWVAERGVYGSPIDYDDMKMGWYIEPSPVIRVGSVVVGIDKIGHFLSQGWFYYQKERELRAALPAASDDEVDRRVRQYGHELEIGYLGLGGTGIYSYADLAANWQGLWFYRALLSGPDPYIAIEPNGRYRLAHQFHITDYVTDAWDEVINPSRPLTDRFFAKMVRYLRTAVCPDYRATPTAFMNASGRTQDPRSYVWEHAPDGDFACKRRISIQDVCR